MAYAGLPPASFANNLTNVQLLDDISSSFNGTTQTFSLTTNSSPFHAVSARSLLVTLGGITQKPNVDYTVSGGNITFTTAPVSGLTFAARNIYGLNYIDSVNDGSITPTKISTGGPSWNTSGDVTITGDLNVSGSFNSGAQGLFWSDNEKANFGDNNDFQIWHEGTYSIIQETGPGQMFFQSNGTGFQFRKTDGTDLAKFTVDGSVDLYYNGSKKLETTTSGITVTGSIVTDDATNYPSIKPSLDLNFAETKNLDSRITFSRDGSATYVDEFGYIKTAPDNTPRFDHDPITRESLGLLIEEPSYNFVDNSLDGVGWNPTRGSFILQTSIVSPAGTTDNVFLYKEDTQTGPHHFKTPSNTPSWTIGDGTTVTASIFVKKFGSKQYVKFGINKKDDVYTFATIDLDTGTLSNIDSGYTATSTAYRDGWYRITFTGDGGTGATRLMPVTSVFLLENGSSTVSSYTGDGISGVYFWGPQIEVKSFATSYIPTNGNFGVGYRGIERPQIKGDNFSSFYNQQEGSFIIKSTPLQLNSGVNDRLLVVESELSFTSGSGPGGFNVDYDNLLMRTEIFQGGSFSTGASFSTGVSNQTEITVALKYGTDDFAFVSNGVVRFNDTSFVVPTGMTKLGIGTWVNNNADANLHIKALKYYPKKLTNTQLQVLTTQ